MIVGKRGRGYRPDGEGKGVSERTVALLQCRTGRASKVRVLGPARQPATAPARECPSPGYAARRNRWNRSGPPESPLLCP